jgi:hypothetical protein
MQMLYDSDNFVVVAVDLTPEGVETELIVTGDVFDIMTGRRAAPSFAAFEIVDKRVNKEVFLNGDWAQSFQRVMDSWKEHVPTQDMVEDALDGYCQLAQLPIVLQ